MIKRGDIILRNDNERWYNGPSLIVILDVLHINDSGNAYCKVISLSRLFNSWNQCSSKNSISNITVVVGEYLKLNISDLPDNNRNHYKEVMEKYFNTDTV